MWRIFGPKVNRALQTARYIELIEINFDVLATETGFWEVFRKIWKKYFPFRINKSMLIIIFDIFRHLISPRMTKSQFEDPGRVLEQIQENP